MCDPVIGGIALAGTLYSGYSANKSAKKAAKREDQRAAEQKILDEQHAADIKEQAAYEAKKIRAEAIKIRSSQVAQQAASGVMVGNGSTQAMVDETTRLAEQDAYITLFNGEKGYLYSMEQGRLAMMESKARSRSIRDQGKASLLGSVSQAAAFGYKMA